MPKPLSLTAAAATLGVSRNTVTGWIAKGCPVVSRADRGRGIEWRLDVGAIHAWRVDEAVRETVAGFQGADGGVSKDEADRRRAVALAIVAEIDADTALKSVMSRADADAILADFCQALRSALSNAGAKIANRTASMTRPAEIRDFCQEVINKAFGAAEQDLTERWAGDMPDEDLEITAVGDGEA